jgi:AraC-like DNA-binding protein
VAVQRDPIRVWREEYARCCLNLDFEPSTGVPFHFALKPVFEDPRVVRTSLSAGFVFRDEDLVRDGDDSYGFLISQSRQLDTKHQGREVRLGLGEATMMQASGPGSAGSRESFAFCEVMIAPAEWDARSARPGDAIMRRLSRRSEALQLLRGYIRSLERNRLNGSAQAREIVRRHVIDLVVLAATPHRTIGESGASAVVAARLAAALDQIAARFHDPELSVTAVAQSLRISVRYLQRVLETSGVSFTARVTELRLQRALALLREPGPRRISDIALEVGFSDLSHFNRSFRSRFGDTPSALRAQSCRATLSDAQASSETVASQPATA